MELYGHYQSDQSENLSLLFNYSLVINYHFTLKDHHLAYYSLKMPNFVRSYLWIPNRKRKHLTIDVFDETGLRFWDLIMSSKPAGMIKSI